MDFSSLFTQDPSISFLNAGTQSRVPLELLGWMRGERDRAELNPTKAMFESFPLLWEVQKEVAGFLTADPADLFLRTNITSAFNDFLFALPLPADAEILVSNQEYGAISELARWRARNDGLGFRDFSLPAGSVEEVVASVLAALRPKTRLVIMSHVVTATGAVLPIREIARALREREILFLVDGAHAIGAIPVSLRELGDVDFYGGNFHKWFMGPAGTGFGWVNPRWNEKLDWKFGGWASFRVPAMYGSFGDGHPEVARRLMPGTIDFVPFLALREMVRFWREHGAEKIRARQQGWRKKALQLGLEYGWKNFLPKEDSIRSALVSFTRPERWGPGPTIELATRIYRECRVQIALTQVGSTPLVRLSPPAYARDGEVEEGMSRLKDFSV